MVLDETRVTYVREFIQSLFSPEGNVEDKLQQVLQETMTQSLEELEKRFGVYVYRNRFHLEADPQKIQATVARMEKRCNSRFYTANQHERKSEIRHIHREALKNCWSILTSDLDLVQSTLMDDLFASDIVPFSDKESIKGRDTRKRQNDELYAYIVGRLTFDEFNTIFLPALNKDHQHLADALMSELDRLEDEYQDLQCVACRSRDHVQLKRLAEPLRNSKVIDMPMYLDLRGSGLSNNSKWAELRHTVSDSDIIKAMERKYPDFYQEFLQKECTSMDCCCPKQDVADTADATVPTERLMSDQESISGYETCYSGGTYLMDIEEDVRAVLTFQDENFEQDYKMTANPRGMCLIINNCYFKGTHLPDRIGSQVSAEKLSETFRRLNFDVVCMNDLSTREMKVVLEDYSKLDHGKYDAFICALSSHGNKDSIQGIDADFVEVSDLTSMFKATRCLSLAGKPKIFIIESSRGTKLMDGVRLKDEPTEETVADEADFLIAYSTAEGYVNFRNTTTGSHYINALTKVLDSQADEHDLLDCLIMTNRELSRFRTQSTQGMFHGRQQVPAPVFTLTKKVHFTSDPMWAPTTNDQ